MSQPATATDTPPWLQSVADVLEESIWAWDAAADRVVFTNGAFRRQLGLLAPEGTPGSSLLLDHVHADDRERLRAARSRLPAHGYVEDYRLVHPATATAPARIARLQERAVPMHGPRHGLQVTHVVRDVTWQLDTTTGQRRAEQALAASEAKYRKVVENVGEGILVTAEGRILYANPKALALTGVDEQAALARPFIDFLHPDDRERVVDNHVRRLRGEAVEQRYQFRVVTMAGEIRWLEISGVVVEWEGAPATLNFLSDVTKRRQAEDELRSALTKERELSELKSRFVAIASHEFRTPLAAILSSIELLDDYGSRLPETERREIVGLVKGAVARMNGMVEQVLLTSRLEAGQFQFDPQPHAVADLLVQVAAELEQAHPQASRVQMRCDGVDALRRVDPRLLRHVLMNLLSNALKYSPADSAVLCTLTGEGDQLRLEVADRGIGIPAADMPRLFERFHRGANVGNIQGTGIGLHVVRECVQLHGGFVDVDSAPGQGTTFRARLHAPVTGH